METKKEYYLEILPDDQIQVLIQTVYFKANGQELTRENWRTVLTKDQYHYAKEILDARSLHIVESVWGIEG